jgi:hypothetical protein
MKVAAYHQQGLRHWVETPPEGWVPLGREAREGGHRVAFFARVADGRLAEVAFHSSRRCRKLLALADVAAERLRGQPAQGYTLDPEALLTFFAEERDRAKMQARVDLLLRALGLAP